MSETTTAKALHQRMKDRTAGHTPRPWKVVQTEPDQIQIVGTRREDPEPDGRVIALIQDTDTEAKSDAHLIAAAPETARQRDELLETAEDVFAKLRYTPHNDLQCEALSNLGTAIARAKGPQS